jgi:hypothetical protein
MPRRPTTAAEFATAESHLETREDVPEQFEDGSA